MEPQTYTYPPEYYQFLETLKTRENKFEDDEITPELTYHAIRFAQAYEGSYYTFVLDMKRKLGLKHSLSVSQIRGILNCMRSEMIHKASIERVKNNPDRCKSKIPEGNYLVDVLVNGETRLVMLEISSYSTREQVVSHLTLQDPANPYSKLLATKFGILDPEFRVAPAFKHEQFLIDAITKLLENPDNAIESSKRYGRKTGRCGICKRVLTDPKSIALGIGPICAERF